MLKVVTNKEGIELVSGMILNIGLGTEQRLVLKVNNEFLFFDTEDFVVMLSTKENFIRSHTHGYENITVAGYLKDV